MVIFSMQIIASDQNRAIVLRSLGAMLAPTRVESGCLDARLFSDVTNRKVVMLVEEWDSHEQFRRQLDQDKLKVLVAAMELSSEAPQIHIDTTTREEGLDAFALASIRLRGAND